jgi:hypothetical protein
MVYEHFYALKGMDGTLDTHFVGESTGWLAGGCGRLAFGLGSWRHFEDSL